MHIGSYTSNMHNYIYRNITDLVIKRLENNPVVALLGARQTGKSTLAKEIIKSIPNALYLDLEKQSDRHKIESDPELFFKYNSDRFICLDEIQILPDLFSSLRSYVDENNKNFQFLILGSASRDLIRQSSESLAGRIAYLEISPFLFNEMPDNIEPEEHWLKGGYPKSILQKDSEESYSWRENYIKTFLERDIPQLGFSIPAKTLERFWTMLAHNHCQILNYSSLGKSLGTSHHTIKSYIDILEQTFVIRTLKPYMANPGRRLVKSAKAYIRDTGLLHTLLGIGSINELLGHPVAGHSFESYIIENIINSFPRWNPSFYRDSHGNEIDLILEKGAEKIAIEIRLSTAPQAQKGFLNAVNHLNPTECWVIGQVDSTYPGSNGLTVTNLKGFIDSFQKRL